MCDNQPGQKTAGRSAGRKRFSPLRFARDRKGSAAIEFAALALPFSLLLFAILETCLSFAAQQLLANSADKVARELRTGQIKAADLDEQKLRDLICADLEIIVTSGCPGLEVDLKEYNTYAAAAAVKINFTSDNDIDTSDFAVTPGKSQTKNMLRVFYRWPVITEFMKASLAKFDGKAILFSTVTWQNEPFND